MVHTWGPLRLLGWLRLAVSSLAGLPVQVEHLAERVGACALADEEINRASREYGPLIHGLVPQ